MCAKSILCIRNLSLEAKSTKFFTTPIYYVNANPHIGHLYSSLIADASKRWQQIFKKDSSVKFSTGCDEHGLKIQQAAQKNQTSPLHYCDKISSRFKDLADEFSIGYTDFIRTSDQKHKSTVELFWKKLEDNNHIYLSNYEGWYCIQDETFLKESQIVEKTGDDGKKFLVSMESGHPVEWTTEENFMFKLSKFRSDIEHWITRNEHTVRPKKFQKILLDFLEQEEDLSVSRPSSRVRWGIPVPGRPSHTVYVWLDALVNYLTAVGYGKEGEVFDRCWPPHLHVIGKDILKFHGIYWPAFLMAANLDPPKSILCHSHWTVDGEKMSKSKGNVVCPFDRAQTYTTDGLRYFLLREGVSHSDGNYSDTKVLRILNSELADTLGNLLSRCCGTVLNPDQKFPKIDSQAFDRISSLDCTKNLLEHVAKLPGICRDHYESLNFYKVADAVMTTLHVANLFFETLKPWELKKNSESREELKVVLHVTLETLRVSAILLQPMIPRLSETLLDKLAVGKGERFFDDLDRFSWAQKEFEERHLGMDKVVLFRRISLGDDLKGSNRRK
ncbi:unnamed protein product [Phaedon cochleariae]|uniref:Methionine--tRNA ligase, mitochondrial n=1 Tax=Phaedon cochleariae TaxID=80249 RepID=A0A9P0DIM1_PHACE|nr:unnamed protein product [Phaedon cochleariae]